MALKDLKSDLSKFRMPKNDPLENKKIVEVSKISNQTPLSSLADSAPKIPRSQTTTNKEGVEPRKFDNSSQFLGETTPNKMDNSSQFLGETTPVKSNLVEKFLGETTPNKMDNSPNFLGETTPTKSNLQERFLGETTPNKFDNSENFLGETTPKPANNESRFLGETTPSSTNNTGQFLGETNPNKFDNNPNFLGETTPTPANNESRFLGETTPTPANNESRFLGETTPSKMDNSSNFLGETTPKPANNESGFLGETTPNKFNFNPNHSDRATTPSDVNYFEDIHATGFNSKFGGIDSTKYIGINPNNTVFDSTNSLYSNIDDSKFTVGKTYEQSFDSAGRLNSGETGFGIGKAQAQRQSPSFLDRMYDKFNLKADSFNNGLGLFRHPLILRGIQREGIDKGEPQLWGIGRSSFDDGFIRGGTITSTVRAAVDVARVGAWLASVEGLLWSAKQVGLQRTNKFGKIWNPINMLAAVGGQHIGIKPQRSGIIPFNDETVKYGNIINGLITAENTGGFLAKKAASLVVNVDTLDIIWDKLDKYNDITGWRLDERGGFNSLYGINTNGPTIDRRYVNSRISNTQKFKILNQYNPISNDPSKNPTNISKISTEFDDDNTPIGKDSEISYFERKPEYQPTTGPNDRGPQKGNDAAGVIYNDEYTYGENREGIDGNDLSTITDVVKDDVNNSKVNLNLTETHTTYDNPFNKKINFEGSPIDINKNDTSAEIIKNYETVAYGNIPDRIAGDTTFNDFRSLLSDTNPNKKIADDSLTDYKNKNIDSRVGFGTPGKLGVNEDRIEWWNTVKKGERYDRISSLDIGESEIDLIQLWFQADGGSKVQFRGTVSGITETFSPSWESFKYNGRADQAYKYTTFERSLSFNFKVYATSRIEMKPIWRKLQYLSTMTMPQYGGDAGYQGTLLTFRLGDLYNGKLAFIESLTYNMSDETPWDINIDGDLGELPMGIDVSIGLKILGNVIPKLGTTGIYSWGKNKNGVF